MLEQSLSVIARTHESSEYEDPLKLREDLSVISGKAAAICYQEKEYDFISMTDRQSALNRSKRNAESGHYSVYEHGHITFSIGTNKMMAIILNSLELYSTSEKSARYTTMTGGTELEQELYDKWRRIFNDLIAPYYKDLYTESQIDKLAKENARYMLSVFTNTKMVYTVPFNRAILMCGWLDELSKNISLAIQKEFHPISVHKEFYENIALSCQGLAGLIRDAIGITETDNILFDHKKIGIELFSVLTPLYKLGGIIDKDRYLSNGYDKDFTDKQQFYGDVYISKYKASFAEFAQAERHRTLTYHISIPDKLEPYVPNIIRNSRYEIEWRTDFNRLLEQGIVPQCTLIDITEEGRFENFYLKCKERLCSRAQLEIMTTTRDQVVQFAKYSANLSPDNKMMLDNMIKKGANYSKPETIIVESRCRFRDYICKEPCSVAGDNMNYYRNV